MSESIFDMIVILDRPCPQQAMDATYGGMGKNYELKRYKWTIGT